MTRPLWFAVAMLGIALLGIALACGRDPILVATIESVQDASVKCELSDAGDVADACGQGWFCSATTCGSTIGTCEIIGAAPCDEATGPECGCDGLNYFNQCLREQARVSRAAVGSCESQIAVTAKQCPCQAGQFCATISPQPLFDTNLPDGAPLPPCEGSFGLPDGALTDLTDRCREAQKAFSDFGFCWVLPPACPPSSDRRVFGCDFVPIDECAAIKHGGAYALCPTSDASAN